MCIFELLLNYVVQDVFTAGLQFEHSSDGFDPMQGRYGPWPVSRKIVRLLATMCFLERVEATRAPDGRSYLEGQEAEEEQHRKLKRCHGSKAACVVKYR